jgi:hypothetical protein
MNKRAIFSFLFGTFLIYFVVIDFDCDRSKYVHIDSLFGIIGIVFNKIRCYLGNVWFDIIMASIGSVFIFLGFKRIKK